MDTIKKLTPFLHVTTQISAGDVGVAAALGFRSIVNNRPDQEGEGQPASADLAEACARSGLGYVHVPVISGQVSDDDVAKFTQALTEIKGPVLAFCRTGTRSTTLWALAESFRLDPDVVLKTAAEAGYDISALRARLDGNFGKNTPAGPEHGPANLPITASHDVVIIGGGAGGLSVAAGLLNRRPGLDIAIVEPSDRHYYQPGWTLVGGGVFDRSKTTRAMADVMTKSVKWVRAACSGFEPDKNRIVLEDGSRIAYRTLVVAPGIKLNWAGVEGLHDTLGKNGVTSNYRFDLAPYTWELVQSLRSGRALFTQPPMPIKCAGAPQKAMYLSCDAWLRAGRLKDIDVQFHSSGAVLFGVKDYVPALMTYVERYNCKLNFNETLVAIDGPGHKAWFDVKNGDGAVQRVERDFDMIHVTPPQQAPDFVRNSPLADAAGWVEVSPETLQHSRYGNIFGLGDACSAPNAKTAAAIRKQAPTVALNVLSVLDGKGPRAVYDGYGSCPLTVERGKIILAEFKYGGKLAPTFAFLDGTKPSRFAWLLKEKMLPSLYWDAMLKGREWMVHPDMLPHEPQAYEAQQACDMNTPDKEKTRV